ncbi:Saccharopine dehydrogenase-domain-containing protein [Sparassis latifolia]
MAVADILLLGATGYTGRLIARYLCNHPQRATFTLAVAGRSKVRLESLKTSVALDDRVELLQIDVAKPEELDAAVEGVKVVINAVGPYWRWGTEVVRACTRHGVHYVDLAAETPWIQKIIFKFDYFASKTNTIIIPSCGLVSAPADLLVHLANKTLKDTLGPDVSLGESLTVYDMPGLASGGTYASALSLFEDVPRARLTAAMQDYSLSSAIHGAPSESLQLARPVPFTRSGKHATFHPISFPDRAVVQRTWGLHALAAQSVGLAPEDTDSARRRTYGPRFTYDEGALSPVPWSVPSALISAGWLVGLTLLMIFPPVRWIFKAFVPSPGEGPSDKVLEAGFIEATNYTTSAPSPDLPETHVKTVLRGRGDPGYLLSSMIISECALALLLDKSLLPPLARVGGVLTPASALGDVLINRLEACGRFEFESVVVPPEE